MEKSTSAENRQVLKRILAADGNNRCADCKTAQHPRWASWNIGILICIRCSGVHRSLGTHISKVRSIDLDTWSDLQLEKLVAVGNKKANAYWEAKLPPNYVPDEGKLPSFIKTKYELKRWCSDEQQTIPDLPPKIRQDSVPQSSSSSIVDLLELNNQQQQKQPEKLVNVPATSLMQNNAPTPALKDRNDVKKSILSLYSQPSSSVSSFSRQSTPSVQAQSVQAQSVQSTQSAQNSLFDLDDISSVWK